LIAETTGLDWLILTKRPERIAECLPAGWENGWPNVWLGTSIDDRKDGVPRIDHLRRIPAVVHFLSVEPLLEDLGPIDLTGIDWVIVGGESDQKGRQRSLDLALTICLQDHRRRNRVPFFMKQDSGRESGLQGRIADDLWRIKEFPTPRTAATVE
jgi:protein gp37